MQLFSPYKFNAIRKYCIIGLLVASGFLMGRVWQGHSSAVADIRKTPPRQSFLSGSERSETYLKEIAGTLKRIESRIGRIEQAVKKTEK